MIEVAGPLCLSAPDSFRLPEAVLSGNERCVRSISSSPGRQIEEAHWESRKNNRCWLTTKMQHLMGPLYKHTNCVFILQCPLITFCIKLLIR